MAFKNENHVRTITASRSSHPPSQILTKGNKRLTPVNFRVAEVLQVILTIR